jgi:hypothetical protein
VIGLELKALIHGLQTLGAASVRVGDRG